jgi:hypothetical protein
VLEGYSEAHEQELRDMAGRGPGLFDDLARSICPSVYGCEAVKKAVLLMLLGGMHKKTKEVRGAAPLAQNGRRGLHVRIPPVAAPAACIVRCACAVLCCACL